MLSLPDVDELEFPHPLPLFRPAGVAQNWCLVTAGNWTLSPPN